jgi:hypothetical protein
VKYSGRQARSIGPAYTRNPPYIRNVNITNVNITKINTIIAAAPAAGDPPPQVFHQQFANRPAALST